jgi:preprotein translocase subunit SecD
MPSIRLRLRWKFSPLIAKFVASVLILGVLSTVALPATSTYSLLPLKNNIENVIPMLAEKLPNSLNWEKPVFRFGEFTNDKTFALGLDIQGGTQVTLAADMSSISESERATALESVLEVLRRRVDLYGVSEPRIRTSVLGDQYRIIVELPGVNQPEEAIALIGQTAKLQFREPGAETLALQQEAVASQEAALAYINSFQPTGLDGEKLEKATVTFSPQTNEPTVSLQFTGEGSQLFTEITQRNISKPVGIYLDDQPVSFPVVNETIYGGQAMISGGFTLEQAQTLVAQLNSGALPVSLEVLEQQTIGPSLGFASLQQSLIAGIIGLVLVMCFMTLLYGWGGVVANIGLIAYGIVTISIYKILPVTLTLPGMAGLILSIGMAVDSNILTFERIKEETRAGKPWSVALKRGFGRSWESIKGANMATLAICAILFNPLDWGWLHTSGPVRGFALTLALGIVISLFTGVFFSRILMQLFIAPPKTQEDPL